MLSKKWQKYSSIRTSTTNPWNTIIEINLRTRARSFLFVFCFFQYFLAEAVEFFSFKNTSAYYRRSISQCDFPIVEEFNSRIGRRIIIGNSGVWMSERSIWVSALAHASETVSPSSALRYHIWTGTNDWTSLNNKRTASERCGWRGCRERCRSGERMMRIGREIDAAAGNNPSWDVAVVEFLRLRQSITQTRARPQKIMFNNHYITRYVHVHIMVGFV